MARITITFDGSTAANGSPLLMHNERLADPIDPYTRWLAELTKKRSKTERDHEEIGRREFLGGGYWSVDGGPNGKQSRPIIPTWNIIRCLQEAATRHKLGRHVGRGILPVEEETLLVYDGPTDAAKLWEAGTFHSRKGVGVGQKRVIRTRPCFIDWSIEAELELDLTILDPDVVDLIAREAGKYVGLADGRPRFGRFRGSATLIGDLADYIAVDEMDDLRARLAVETGARGVAESDVEHAKVHPNGKGRRRRIEKAVS